jgi:hypothetical protein
VSPINHTNSITPTWSVVQTEIISFAFAKAKLRQLVFHLLSGLKKLFAHVPDQLRLKRKKYKAMKYSHAG